MIEEPGIEGEDAGETPIDRSELAGEAHFDGIHGPDALDVGLDKLLEGPAILIGENDGVVGEAAVLESVHGRTGFAIGSGGALGFGSVDTRLVRTSKIAHIKYFELVDGK